MLASEGGVGMETAQIFTSVLFSENQLWGPNEALSVKQHVSLFMQKVCICFVGILSYLDFCRIGKSQHVKKLVGFSVTQLQLHFVTSNVGCCPSVYPLQLILRILLSFKSCSAFYLPSEGVQRWNQMSFPGKQVPYWWHHCWEGSFPGAFQPFFALGKGCHAENKSSTESWWRRQFRCSGLSPYRTLNDITTVLNWTR